MASKPQLVLAGGSGFLGRLLILNLQHEYDFLVLGRKAGTVEGIPCMAYPKTDQELATLFEGSKAVINLAGKSVNCRPNKRNKREILNSRIHSTERIGRALRL